MVALMVPPEPPLIGSFDPVTAAAAVTTAPELLTRDFGADDVTALRHAVRDHAMAAGLLDDALADFVVAVHELVANAVRHGGGHGCLRLRRDGDTLICDVTDHGGGFPDGVPAPAAPPAADVPGGRGILLARQLTDNLLISDGPEGVTATVTVCLPAAAVTPAVVIRPAAVADDGDAAD